MSKREISVGPDDVAPTTTREGGLRYVLIGNQQEGQWVHLLRLPPGYYAEAHYHDCDQFQIVIEGSVEMAGEVLGPGSVHYTDAHTPYGPFRAGAQGLSLMVIRPGVTEPALYVGMPTVIERIKASQIQHITQGDREEATWG
jgi:hypothetical protein